MPDELATRYAALQAIAREAGQLAWRHFNAREGLETDSKGIQDPVSNAVRQVEALLIESLRPLFPSDGFLGEESGAHGNRDCLWVIDPIDGTNNFLRGIPYWAVSVAYVRNGHTELGVIYHPCTDELYAGRRSRGATCNGEPIRASASTEMKSSVIGFAYSRAHSGEGYARAIQELLSASGEYRRMGSAALMLAHVADGRLDGFYASQLNSWDVLAGLLLAQEAGATVNDFLTDDGLWTGNAVLVSAPGLRRELLSILQDAGLPAPTTMPA